MPSLSVFGQRKGRGDERGLLAFQYLRILYLLNFWTRRFNLHPPLFRHQMLTYLTSKGLTDSQIQLISGHQSKKSLEIYQHLSFQSVEKAYQEAVLNAAI
jgi:integrase